MVGGHEVVNLCDRLQLYSLSVRVYGHIARESGTLRLAARPRILKEIGRFNEARALGEKVLWCYA